MSSIRPAILLMLIGAGAPALAQQPSPPAPTPIADARAAFHGMIGLCAEAKKRGVLVADLPAELKETLQLNATPVILPVGAKPGPTVYWSTRLSESVRIRDLEHGCSVELTPGRVEPFDAAAEAGLAADLLAKAPNIAERPYQPFAFISSGRRFSPTGAGPGHASYAVSHSNGQVQAVVGGNPPWNYTLHMRFRNFDDCIRLLTYEGQFAVPSYERIKPWPGPPPAAGLSFYELVPSDRSQPRPAVGEDPVARKTCAYFDPGVSMEDARRAIPDRIGVTTITLEKVGAGTLMIARPDPAAPSP